METSSCGYHVQKYNQPIKRYCQTLDLKKSPILIAKYKQLHSQEFVWPEILAGIRQVGILEMEIFIIRHHLFMIVETPLDFDWDKAMAELDKLPRQREWENYVSVFQSVLPGSTSSQKWQLMDRIFHLYNK
jgi:Uncharacterized conserved protein